MKKTKTTVFSNAVIKKTDEGLLIVELAKKDEGDRIYSLTDELEQWIDEEGISLSIKKDRVVYPEDLEQE